MLWLASTIGIFVVIASSYLSIISSDPHWMQRGGALLAAIASLLAVTEASVEHRLRMAEDIGPNDADGMQAYRFGIGRIIGRVRWAQFRGRHSHLSSSKLKTVFLISTIAIAGEVLHGFGDLLFLAGKSVLLNLLA